MHFRKKISLLLTFTCALTFMGLNAEETNEKVEYITLAIFATDKAHTLPLYLECLEKQSWPADKTYLYIHTDSQYVETNKILSEWIQRVAPRYAEVLYKANHFGEVKNVRENSLKWAQAHRSHYFVANTNSFIIPSTIEELINANLPVVSPLLRVSDLSAYANYHADIDMNGYYKDSPYYNSILFGEVKGLINVPVVHGCYLIQYNVLDKMAYDDHSNRQEYVIFSDNARKKNISQYIDNRKLYGRMSFSEDIQALKGEEWLQEFAFTSEVNRMLVENQKMIVEATPDKISDTR